MNKTRSAQVSPYAANIWRFYVYSALHQLSVWMVAAIWVVYLQQRRGLNMTQVTLIDAIFWVSMALGEVPTGVIADVFGRKLSLVIGEILSCAGMLLYGLAPTFALLTIANVIWAVALTFHSGAGEALLYESLCTHGREGEYAKIVGRAGAVTRGILAVGAVASGLLAALDLVLPFLLAVLFAALALGFAMTFKEPPMEGQERSQKQTRNRYRAILGHAWTALREYPSLRFGVLYLTIVPVASLMMVVTFLQPHAISLGVPVAAVGVLVMAANGASMVGALVASWVGERLGTRRVLYGVPTLIVLCLVFVGVTPLVPSIALIAALAFLTEVARPLVAAIIQDAVSDRIRATVISLRSLLFTFVIAISEPALGVLADHYGLPAAYLGLAGILVLFCALLFWKGQRWLVSKPAYSSSPI